MSFLKLLEKNIDVIFHGEFHRIFRFVLLVENKELGFGELETFTINTKRKFIFITYLKKLSNVHHGQNRRCSHGSSLKTYNG
jgi:hypothetical protein